MLVRPRSRAGQVADDVRHQDRSNLADFGHGAALTCDAISQEGFAALPADFDPFTEPTANNRYLRIRPHGVDVKRT